MRSIPVYRNQREITVRQEWQSEQFWRGNSANNRLQRSAFTRRQFKGSDIPEHSSSSLSLFHGNQFFRTGWMQRYRIVEIFLGRTHSQCNRKTLQHFIGPRTNDVTTNNFFL